MSELTLITPIKQGFRPGPQPGTSLRYVDMLRLVLCSEEGQRRIQEGVNHIGTVHFARWVIIDGGQRLLFTSNFDGTLDQYLHDFSRRLHEGLDRIWGNCVDYPGARDYESFQAWVWRHQVETQLFYAASPHLTVQDVRWLDALRRCHEGFLQELQEQPKDFPRLFRKLQLALHRLGLGDPKAPAPVSEERAAQGSGSDTECPAFLAAR